MYAQITTRCNMLCRHCCFSCGPDGEDMRAPIFEQAVQLAVRNDNELCIGGGEPTIHPEFDYFLEFAMQHKCRVWITTNGKRTDQALRLLELAKTRKIEYVRLSLDDYHEPISRTVRKAYRKAAMRGRIEIATVKVVYPIGRGRKLTTGKILFPPTCDSGIFIKPNGDIYQCACLGAPKICDVWSYQPIRKSCYNIEYRKSG